MDRRGFLAAGAAGALGAALTLSGCTETGSAVRGPQQVAYLPRSPQPQSAALAPVSGDIQHPVALNRVSVSGTLGELPGEGNLMAWTVDDGSNADVIAGYAAFAARSKTRLTFFLNGRYDAWDATADTIRPMVDSGQIQLGNHTWSHPDLTTLSDDAIIGELQHNHDYIQDTWGVDARPFFRPPFGYHDARVDAAAASIGYTVPTMWYGTLGDSGGLTGPEIVALGETWFLPQRIVIGHLNLDPVVGVLDQLGAIIRKRKLRTVTLNDVFRSAQHP